MRFSRFLVRNEEQDRLLRHPLPLKQCVFEHLRGAGRREKRQGLDPGEDRVSRLHHVVRGEHLDQRGSQEGTGALRHDVQFDPRVEMKELVECRMHAAPRQLWTAGLSLAQILHGASRRVLDVSPEGPADAARVDLDLLVECIADASDARERGIENPPEDVHGTLDEIGAPEDGDRIDAPRLPILLGGYRIGDDGLGVFIAAGDPQQHLEEWGSSRLSRLYGFPRRLDPAIEEIDGRLDRSNVARKRPGAGECPVVEMDVVALQLVPRDRAGPDGTAEERADAMLAEGVFEGVRRRHAEAKHPAVDDAFRPVAIGPVGDAGQALFPAVYARILGRGGQDGIASPLGPPGIEDEESRFVVPDDDECVAADLSAVGEGDVDAPFPPHCLETPSGMDFSRGVDGADVVQRRVIVIEDRSEPVVGAERNVARRSGDSDVVALAVVLVVAAAPLPLVLGADAVVVESLDRRAEASQPLAQLTFPEFGRLDRPAFIVKHVRADPEKGRVVADRRAGGETQDVDHAAKSLRSAAAPRVLFLAGELVANQLFEEAMGLLALEELLQRFHPPPQAAEARCVDQVTKVWPVLRNVGELEARGLSHRLILASPQLLGKAAKPSSGKSSRRDRERTTLRRGTV